jgi:energy-coupling factor transporter ATP-binding protein EcfA2
MAEVANYSTELNQFRALLHLASPKRILLIQGESGSGKTTFINTCLREAPPSLVGRVVIQLRETKVDVTEILFRTRDRIGPKYFPRFSRELETGPGIEVRGNQIIGVRSGIHITLQSDDYSRREARIIDAWFSDLKALRRLVIMAFDTYERATTEVKNWIESPFLSRIDLYDNLRVLIAGRVLPEFEDNKERCCVHTLRGVPLAQHWLPVVHAMKRSLPGSDPESWLQGLCDGLEGNPQLIMQYIERLPTF